MVSDGGYSGGKKKKMRQIGRAGVFAILKNIVMERPPLSKDLLGTRQEILYLCFLIQVKGLECHSGLRRANRKMERMSVLGSEFSLFLKF